MVVQTYSNDHVLAAHQMIEHELEKRRPHCGKDVHCHVCTTEGQLGCHKFPYAEDTREILLPTCNQLQSMDSLLADC